MTWRIGIAHFFSVSMKLFVVMIFAWILQILLDMGLEDNGLAQSREFIDFGEVD